ncbi:MAG: hypothetical protein H0W90_15555 [Actinobacteria bacterium]|nr:hypothetical protein [Actinomycetota bacterium]
MGRPSVAHATATGKVMLAFGAGGLPSVPLAARTRRTITTRAALEQELERVRARGWAESIGEREDDLNAVAAPISDNRSAPVAILGVQGPASRFNAKRIRAAIVLLREHAEGLSAALGARRPV